MAQLLFYDEGHRYELGGIALPSVSEIIRFMSREVYGNIEQWTLDNAASRGTRVHRATQALDVYGQVECDEEIAPYVQAYLKFRKEHKPQWDIIEKPMHHESLHYAGTIDRAGTLAGQYTLVDIKAQEAVKRPLVGAQLNGYALMLPSTVALACLQLRKNGTYKLHSIPMDATTFMACHTLHTAMQRKRKESTPND